MIQTEVWVLCLTNTTCQRREPSRTCRLWSRSSSSIEVICVTVSVCLNYFLKLSQKIHYFGRPSPEHFSLHHTGEGNSCGAAEHTSSYGLVSWRHFALSVGILGGRGREAGQTSLLLNLAARNIGSEVPQPLPPLQLWEGTLTVTWPLKLPPSVDKSPSPI